MPSTVSTQPVSITRSHLPILGVGLAVGLGVAFEVLHASSKSPNRVETIKEYWLLLSGAVQVYIVFSNSPHILMFDQSTIYL